jgi:galactarate dehydratase
VKEKTVAEAGERLFELILDVANGKKTLAEERRLYNFLSFFNPAPMT